MKGSAALHDGEAKQDERDLRLEKARKGLLVALENLRSERTLTAKEADAVEAAIEDELIALRVLASPR